MFLTADLLWKDLLHDRTRFVLNLTGLAVVITSYFILSALSTSMNEMTRDVGSSQNLIIFQRGLILAADTSISPEVLEVGKELIPEYASRVSPGVYRITKVGEHVVTLRAADLSDWEPVFHLRILTGRWPTQYGEIVVGKGTADAFDWTVGTQLTIYGSLFRVSGIFQGPGSAFSSVWMPESDFWTLFEIQPRYSGLFIQVKDGVDPKFVQSRLEEDPRLAGNYDVYLEDAFTQRNFQAIKDLRAITSLAGWLALLGVIFGMFNANALSVVERSREIGILLGIGLSHRMVRDVILIRSIFQAILAFGIGLFVSWLFTISQQMTSPMSILGVPLIFKISLLNIIEGFLGVLLLALVGVWLSSRSIFKIPVAELMRQP